MFRYLFHLFFVCFCFDFSLNAFMFEDMLGMCTAKNMLRLFKVARTFMFWMFFLSFCLNWHQPVICLSLLNGANPFHIMHKRNRCLSLLTRVPNIHSKSFWLPCRRNIHKGHVQLLNEWLCSCMSRTVPPATLRQDNTYVVWYKLCMYIYNSKFVRIWINAECFVKACTTIMC